MERLKTNDKKRRNDAEMQKVQRCHGLTWKGDRTKRWDDLELGEGREQEQWCGLYAVLSDGCRAECQ